MFSMGTSCFTSPLFIVSLLFFTIAAFADGQCQKDQESALLEMKLSFNFNANFSSKLVTWNSSADCCAWSGVICDNAGRVIAIDLSFEGVSGQLDNSSSLFHLQFLRSLNFAVNNFYSSRITPAFGKLVNLVYLNLSNSGFSGQVPIEISYLTRLLVLDLSTAGSSGDLKLENPNFTLFVQNLSLLEELYLGGVNISYEGSELSKAVAYSLPKLKVLSLPNCFLSGPPDWSYLLTVKSLSVIELGMNNLTVSIPEIFANFSNMTKLGLSFCGLYGTFPSKILQIPTLKHLDVSGNPLLRGSFPDFPHINSLQQLILSSTNFSGNLPFSIGNLYHMEIIDLSSCRFGGSIPDSIGNLTRINLLDISHNMLTGTIPSFHSLTNLQDINLRNNSLSGKIPVSLFSLPRIWRINLSLNQFSGDLDAFPNPSSPMLISLDLSSNMLEGPLSNSFFELKSLVVLDLALNRFNGSIRLEAFWKIENLTNLDISFNNISLEGNSSTLLPANIARLRLASCNLRKFPIQNNNSRLYHLDLSNNQIHGEIPKWIWNLNHVNLSGNFLTDMQPPSPYQQSVSVLDLHSNMLKGSIPIFPNSVYLDYSNNNFASTIPADIGDSLGMAVFFSASQNQFSGNIPESICNAPNLQGLDLSRNSLNGTIPSCLLKLSSYLVILNLGGNKIQGQIPGNFNDNCVLQTFDLNGNMLQGQVPVNLSKCKDLEVLNLGNNLINDSFPCWLRTLQSLKVLVLRSNIFHGPLTCPGTNYSSWRLLKIVDLASNNFDGELPSQLFSSWKAMGDSANDPDASATIDHLGFDILKFSQVRYLDRVTVASKGLQLELVKILTIYTSVDLSNNNFHGEIPEELGNLTALYVLDLSHNALGGQIPSSLGNIKNLESFDLSRNMLNGTIPTSLASLPFLSFLNLSFNQLIGMIPQGYQFGTFTEDSFEGNAGLCGTPLNVSCNDGETNKDNASYLEEKSGNHIEWWLIAGQIGFVVGFGMIILPLIIFNRWRVYYYIRADEVALKILEVAGYSRKKIDRIRIIDAM